jgi:hypothetical protein
VEEMQALHQKDQLDSLPQHSQASYRQTARSVGLEMLLPVEDRSRTLDVVEHSGH